LQIKEKAADVTVFQATSELLSRGAWKQGDFSERLPAVQGPGSGFSRLAGKGCRSRASRRSVPAITETLAGALRSPAGRLLRTRRSRFEISIEAAAQPPRVRPGTAASGPANTSTLFAPKVYWLPRSRTIAPINRRRSRQKCGQGWPPCSAT